MGSLPMQTKYKSYAGALMPAIQAAYRYGQPAKRSSKAVDVARFKPLAGQVRAAPKTTIDKTIGRGYIQTTPYMGSTRLEARHPGVDYVIPGGIGAPVQSFTPGTIEKVRTGQVKGGPDFGNFVMVRDNEGNLHRYSHLQNAWVKVGQQVQRGTTLGPQGNTGQTYSNTGGTGAHVDYRIKSLYNHFINPNRFIEK